VNYWRATIEMILGQLLASEHYRDATGEEVVEVVMSMAPPHFRFTSFAQRKLLEEVLERRQQQRPEGDWWTPRRRKQRDAYRSRPSE